MRDWRPYDIFDRPPRLSAPHKEGEVTQIPFDEIDQFIQAKSQLEAPDDFLMEVTFSITVFDQPECQEAFKLFKKLSEEHDRPGLPVMGTDMTMHPFSRCPECDLFITFEKIAAFHRETPAAERKTFIPSLNREVQDNRYPCYRCGAKFLPSLLVDSDKPLPADHQSQNKLQLMAKIEMVAARQGMARHPEFMVEMLQYLELGKLDGDDEHEAPTTPQA